MLVSEELKTHSRYSLCKPDILSLHGLEHDVTLPPVYIGFWSPSSVQPSSRDGGPCQDSFSREHQRNGRPSKVWRSCYCKTWDVRSLPCTSLGSWVEDELEVAGLTSSCRANTGIRYLSKSAGVVWTCLELKLVACYFRHISGCGSAADEDTYSRFVGIVTCRSGQDIRVLWRVGEQTRNIFALLDEDEDAGRAQYVLHLRCKSV